MRFPLDLKLLLLAPSVVVVGCTGGAGTQETPTQTAPSGGGDSTSTPTATAEGGDGSPTLTPTQTPTNGGSGSSPTLTPSPTTGGGEGTPTQTATAPSSGLSPAFDAFSENVTSYLDGDEVVIETNGLPNHTSPYWSKDHPLYVEPTVTSEAQMAPGTIDQFNGSYTLRVPTNPTVAPSSTSTSLGAIGISVSGSVIYNDEEGPGVSLQAAAGGLDYSGAHTGPQSYHYHLEPKAWSNDDDALIGIIADGFFVYGRKCASTGTYPEDLDLSGGHTSTTQHSAVASYHYHIENELYIGTYYIIFPGDYQGTPSQIR